jgi:hypothetical protein
MAGSTQDIFGRRPLEFGGAFAADSACIQLNLDCDDGGSEACAIEGLLTQQMNVQYQQPITRLYEVGSQKTYYVAGRPQGTMNVARVLGPGGVMACFYECLGDVCNADKNDICFCVEANCLGNEDQDFNALEVCLKNVVLQSLGMSVQAQDMIINEQLSLFFTAMLVRDNEDGCPCAGVQEVSCNCWE